MDLEILPVKLEAKANLTAKVTDKSLIEITKNFLDKVSAGLGAGFSPFLQVANAKAAAKSREIAAASDIKIRAMHRAEQEEIKKQINMESITRKSIEYINADAKPADMDDDWITAFYEYSRKISNDGVQELWAKVLAGEANKPQSFSKKTLRLLADLDNKDAELFSNLCRFAFNIGYFSPIILEINSDYYQKYNLNYQTLSHLEFIGLIQFNRLGEISLNNLKNDLFITYGNIRFKIPPPNDGSFNVGRASFTAAGLELIKLTSAEMIDDYADYVQKIWEKQGHVITRSLIEA